MIAWRVTKKSSTRAWAGPIALASLPVLPGALELLGLGLRSTFHGENSHRRQALRIDPEVVDDPRLELLFDPQTSGGLLFGVAPERAGEAVERLRQAGHAGSAVIGGTTAGDHDPGAVGVHRG